MGTGLRAECFKLVSDTGEVVGKITNDELQLIPTSELSHELIIPACSEYQFSAQCKVDKRLWDFLIHGVCSRWRTRRKARKFINRKLNKAN